MLMTTARIRFGGLLLEENEAYLSPNCFRLLELLCQDPGRLYSYEEIHRFIWPDLEYYGESDRNRCHVVKKQLLDVLRKYSPRVNCVRVVSKRGMRLIDPNECE